MGLGFSSMFQQIIKAPASGALEIETGTIPDILIAQNLTRLHTPTGTSALAELRWYKDISTANECTSINVTTAATTYGHVDNGIVLSNPSLEFGSATSYTAGTNASPPVISSTAHGLLTGDSIIVTSSASRKGVVGIEYTVSRTNADSFTLAYAPAPGGTLGAGMFVKRLRVTRSDLTNYILAVTKAKQAVMTLSLALSKSNIKVGKVLRFSNLKSYGMTQLEGVEATVVAVDASKNQVTLDVDTRNFTTFSWKNPTTDGSVGSPATAISSGATTTDASFAQQRLSNQKFTISSTLFASGNEILIIGLNTLYGARTV